MILNPRIRALTRELRRCGLLMTKSRLLFLERNQRSHLIIFQGGRDTLQSTRANNATPRDRSALSVFQNGARSASDVANAT